jgi:hypothetical protein
MGGFGGRMLEGMKIEIMVAHFSRRGVESRPW